MSRTRSKFVFNKRTIFASLVILVLVGANVGVLWTLWALIRGDETTDIAETVGYNPEDLSIRSTQPELIQDIIATPTLAELLPLPPPALPPEPTATSTRVIIDIPTSISLPTATNAPIATDLPTATPAEASIDVPTPTPLPTATSLLLVANLPTVASLSSATPTVTPQPGIHYVIIISIDGLRPDALFLADTPRLDELKAKGAYSPTAQTLSLSITLPSHASMLGGMLPEKHGILWGLPYIGWPGMNGPTLFNVAHDAGLSTAMVFGKQKLNYLALPNSVDKLFGQDVHDTEIKNQALKFIRAGLPNVLFIHFPDVDRVGHAYGWMSPNQFQAITFVDGLIGEIVRTLEVRGYLNNTLLIITADHGGHGFSHGDDSPEDRTIPWLAVGPDISPGLTLTTPINTYDTAATAAYALKLPIPDVWDGQPVLEIFE